LLCLAILRIIVVISALVISVTSIYIVAHYVLIVNYQFL
jgi:hypothetical protein